MQLIENLAWRYATKKMDATKKVSDTDIEKIKEAVQLTASSYGLQPYKVLDIRDADLRAQLQPFCWNQSQITEASHLWIFCNQVTVTGKDIDAFIALKAKTSGIDIEQLEGYGTFMKGKIKEKTNEEVFNWTAKQAYISLGTALAACAELKIDSTPMEGFEADKVNELLQLNEQGLNASVLLAIGYRSAEDASQHAKKVRKTANELFEIR